MKNTVEEIILKIESAQRWNQYQGERGRFIKGNPGRGLTKGEHINLANRAETAIDRFNENFKYLDDKSKYEWIRDFMKIKGLKQRPDQAIAILRGLFLSTVTMDQVLRSLAKQIKKHK